MKCVLCDENEASEEMGLCAPCYKRFRNEGGSSSADKISANENEENSGRMTNDQKPSHLR